MKGPKVILFLLCVCKCCCMSSDELKDFAKFLRRTSALDQNLKDNSGNGFESEEDEAPSDHAWEDSGKFEGDLILNSRQRRLLVEDVAEGLARNGLRDSTKKWPNNEVIYYIQKEHFTEDHVQAIENGIEDLGQASCVKFRPYKKGDRDAVVIQGSRRGCFSQVGYQGGYQVLNLSGRHPVGRGCFRHGTVVHELLHTLGFYHMQSSPDRDDFIDVKWENIVEPAKHNFRKYNSFSVSDFGVGYDYDSVLHYSRRAFSSNGQDTLVPKQGGARIGQRVGLSDKDTQKLNKMYCDADSNNFEAADEPLAKPIKKKKAKNQPFQGHGIGYHQGKTVVIQLPAAETYKLPDYPTYHTFDYFSKAPKTVSPLFEGLGIREEVNKKPNHYKFTKENKPYSGNTPSLQSTSTVTGTKNPDESTKAIHQKSNENKNKNKNDDKSTYDSEADLLEAINRLGKIIKSHVYPSYTSTDDFLKGKTDYKKFYIPEYKPKGISEADKIDMLFDKKYKSEQGNSHILESGQNDTNIKISDKKPSKYYEEFDASYGTSFPNKEIGIEKKIKYDITDYAEKPIGFNTKESPAKIVEDGGESLDDKHDFSKLYQKSKLSSPINGSSYKLFGEAVPLSEPWFKVKMQTNVESKESSVEDYSDEMSHDDESDERDAHMDENTSKIDANPEQKLAIKSSAEKFDMPNSVEEDFEKYHFHDTPQSTSTVKTEYLVTEESDEKETDQNKPFVKSNKTSNEDYEEFNGYIEDRLNNILSGYTKIDSEEIGKPNLVYNDSHDDFNESDISNSSETSDEGSGFYDSFR